MFKTKKIKAFTLAEILVAMAITTIVVGLTFMVLSLFTKNLHSIEDNYSRNTTIDLLEQQLTVDFNRYSEKKYFETREELTLKTPLDSVTYIFSQDFLVRNSDTLYKGGLVKTLFIKGKKINEGTIDAIKIGIEQPRDTLYLFIVSKGDAKTIMETDGN